MSNERRIIKLPVFELVEVDVIIFFAELPPAWGFFSTGGCFGEVRDPIIGVGNVPGTPLHRRFLYILYFQIDIHTE